MPTTESTSSKGRAILRTLAKFNAGPLPVISVYLNTQWHDQHQRARTITFFVHHLHQARALEPETAAARQSLAYDLERLTHWGQPPLQSPGESPMPGVALFACAGAGLWVEFPSPVPFEDALTVAACPMLRQLARLDEDYTSALLVLVDSRTARIYEVVLGGFLAETDFASEVPGRHKQGGGPRRAINAMCRSTSIVITKRSPRMWPPIWPPIRTRSSSSVATTTSSRVSLLAAPVGASPGHRDGVARHA